MNKLFLSEQNPKIKDVYLCTGDEGQVQIIADNKQQALSMYKRFHGLHKLKGSGTIEIINLNEFYLMV